MVLGLRFRSKGLWVLSLTTGAFCLGVPLSAIAQKTTEQKNAPMTLPPTVAQSLSRAGKNRAELAAAWNQTPQNQREGLRFLVENMPDSDLQTLSAVYLRAQVALAYQALADAPWKGQIPKAIFLNDVLPYSCLNETRDASRQLLREKCLPLIADCKTSAEAAQKLNTTLFPLLNVRYSTERKKPDQNSTETMQSGKATCSGLSILLVNACRSVGIPARVVGTPLWANLRGNHTWVEIWDGRQWRFTGAAEPDEKGLDRGWFVGDAAQARKDKPQHSIYASSFKKTGTAFPLVWAENIRWVPAENVTDRYTAKAIGVAPGKTRLLVKALDTSGKRIAATIALQEVGKAAKPLRGISKDERADLNDMLAFEVFRACPPRQYEITVSQGGKTVKRTIACGMNAEEIIVVRLDGTVSSETALDALFADRFGADATRKAFAQKALEARTANTSAFDLAWQAYKTSEIHRDLKAEWEKKTVSTPERTAPYLWRTVGEKPAGGWGLVIAMHGGGNAPKELNDNQWKGMFERYYKDHPEAGGYFYLALRAPNDTWNGFYDDAICPMIERLIRQFVLFSDVNPDKVFAMGASHGGYGTFVIGPKIPYRFAGLHVAAAAPTDGETFGENLRNVPLTITVGVLDTAYGRIERSRKFMTQVEEWRKAYGGYTVSLAALEGVGHQVPDKDELATLLKNKRDAAPQKLVWTQSDTVLKRFYWLEALAPVEGGHIEATVSGNTITIKADKQERIALWLNASLVDMSKPIKVEVIGGKSQTFTLKPSLETYCLGLEQTSDPHLTAPVRVEVNLK